MRSRTLLIALAVVSFLVVGLPGSAAAEHVTPTDGSPSEVAEVTDVGTGTGPATSCVVYPDGTIECTPCDVEPPFYCM